MTVSPSTDYGSPYNKTLKEFNTFRLPVGWQYLTSTPGGILDATNFAKYDKLVQACLNTGAYCIIDIHNYARYVAKIMDTMKLSHQQLEWPSDWAIWNYQHSICLLVEPACC